MEAVAIELGSDRGEVALDHPPPLDRSRRGAIRWRKAVIPALLVMLSVTGASAPAPELIPVGSLSVPSGSFFLVAGDILLVIEARARPATMSAYDMVTGHAGGRIAPARRWSVDLPPAATYAADRAGDLLLVTELDSTGRAVATTARSAATGAVRWRSPGRVRSAGDTSTGLAVTEVRSLSGAGRRVEGAVRAVDLATGRTRWSVPVRSTAVVQAVPGVPPRVLLLDDSTVARLYDLDTGAVVGEGRLPPADYAPDNPRVVGSRLVMRHPSGSGSAVTGYDLPALTSRWTRAAEATDETVRACGDLVCLEDQRELRGIDPGSGAVRWTGRSRRGWRTISPAGVPPLIWTRAAEGRALVAVGDGDEFRLVGVLPVGVVECRAGWKRVVCRTGPDRLAVWRLR